jgi:acyl-CoA thioesterase
MALLHFLEIRPQEVGAGRSRVEVVVSEKHLRSRGIAHGGLLATLMDTALGWAAGSRAPAGLDVVTVQLNVNFIRPARPGEILIAWGEVQHAGRRTAVARGEIQTAEGALVASGSATLMYVQIDPA